MALPIKAVIELLASEAGNLAYHLVLVFSIAVALQMAVSQPAKPRSASKRRMIIGLGLLFGVQLGLFIAAGLAWQGLIDRQFWLPVIDRVAALFTLVVIAWLWGFPQSNHTADAAAISIGLLGLVVSITGALRWRQMYLQIGLPGFPLNGSQIDIWMQIASLFVIFLGMLALFVARHPWGKFGMAMLVLLACGHSLQLVVTGDGGSYPTILRLFEMAAFPFLIFLPQQLSAAENPFDSGFASEEPTRWSQERPISGAAITPAIDLLVLQSLLLVSDDMDEEQSHRRIVTILAAAAGAERAFLVSPPDQDDKMRVLCDFDRSASRFLESTPLEASELPILTSCLRQGRVRRLAAASTAPDRIALSRIYGLEQAGELLFVPFLSEEGDPLNGAVLVASDAQVQWDAEKQTTIGLLARLLVDFAKRSHENQTLQNELNQTRQSIRRLQEQGHQALDESQRLRDRIAVLQENLSREKEQIALLSTVTLDRDALEKQIAALEEEKRKLEAVASQARQETAGRSHPLEEELRLTLSEIALLRLSMEEAEMQLAEARPPAIVGTVSEEQRSEMLDIARDLRQPVESITDYAEALQNETAGMLTPDQQKYLERIRLSTRRLSSLVDELARTARAEANPENLNPELIEVDSVIQDVISQEESLIRLRRLWLQTEMPEKALQIKTDREALRSVVDGLLHNAGTATPEGGQIGISVRLDSRETDRDYVLLQVFDRGGGISLQDMPRIFAPPTAGERINGLGDGSVDISRLKTLVDALGGRLWVDSEADVGSTFNLLLPVAPGSEGVGTV